MKRPFALVAPRPAHADTADNIEEWSILQPDTGYVHVSTTAPAPTATSTPQVYRMTTPAPERWLQVYPWGWCSVLYDIIWAPSTFTWDSMTSRWTPTRWSYVRPWVDYGDSTYTAETDPDVIDIDVPYPTTDMPHTIVDTPHVAQMPTPDSPPVTIIPSHTEIIASDVWYKIHGWGWCCVQHDILWRPSQFTWNYDSYTWTPSQWMYVRPFYP